MELWTFQRSLDIDIYTIMFNDIEITGDFSVSEIELAIRAMHATVKGTQ